MAGKAMKDHYDFASDRIICEQMALCLKAIGTDEEEHSLAKLTFLASVLSKKHGGDLEAALQRETTEFINQYNFIKNLEEKNEQV